MTSASETRLPPVCVPLNRSAIPSRIASIAWQLRGVVDGPVLLRREADPGAVRSAAPVGAAERGRRAPGRQDQLGDVQLRAEYGRLEVGHVVRVDQFVVHLRNRILPEFRLRGDPGAESPDVRPEIAVGQLVPGPREGVGELVGVRVEAPRDPLVGRIGPEREVRREHHRGMAPRRIVGVRHGADGGRLLRCPLLRARGTLGELPLVAEEVLEEGVVPLYRAARPSAFRAAREGVDTAPLAVVVPPPQALLLDACAFGLGTDVLLPDRPVGLAEGVSAGDERDRLLVAHRHAAERLPDVRCRRQRIGDAVRPFRIHVDEPHLHGAERLLELTVAAVARILQPGLLGPPVDVLFGLPDVLPPSREAEGLESHRLQGAVAGEDHQVGPGDLAAVLLLDRPEQPARLVEVGVVRPAVERRETESTGPRAAAAVIDAVGARAVPCHADEQRPVVAVVRGPPGL